MEQATVKAQIDADLPVGTPAERVEAWLAGKDIAHSGLIDNAKLAHMGFDPETYEIKAMLHGSGHAALVRTDTQLSFLFDRKRHLTKTTVAPVHTGP